MQKALVKTEIYRFLDEKQIFTIDEIVANAESLYQYLKNNKYFGDLTQNLTLDQFKQQIHIGLVIAHTNFQFFRRQ